MGALTNNACDGTKAPKRPNVKKTGILSYAPHNEFWSTLRSALNRHLSCLKCESRAVRAPRGKSAGDARRSPPLIPASICPALTPPSPSCLRRPSSRGRHRPGQAVHQNACPAPPPFPSISCTQTPGGSTGPDSPPLALAPRIDWFLW